MKLFALPWYRLRKLPTEVFIWWSLVTAIGVFVLWPFAAIFLRVFAAGSQPAADLFAGLLPQGLICLRNSFFIAVLTSLLAVALSLAVAVFCCYSTCWWRRFVLPMLFLTMIAPPFASSLAYIALFGRRGFITHTVLGLSLNPYGWHGIVIMEVLGEVSLLALLLIGALRAIDGNILAASRDLGASFSSTLQRVILPLLLPSIGAAAFLAFVKSLADFGTPIVVGGEFSVLATEAYLFVIGRGDVGKAAIYCLLLVLPAVAALLFWQYAERRCAFSLQPIVAPGVHEPVLRLGGRWTLFLGGITALFVTLMALQLVTIALSAVTRYTSTGYVFTLEYLAGFPMDKWLSIGRSFLYAVIAGAAASLLGILLAYFAERRKAVGAVWICRAADLPYVMPGTMFGIGYILAFHKDPLVLTGTVAIVILNCIFRQVAVSAKAARAALLNMSTVIEDSAADLGAGRLAVFREILLPLLKPVFAVGFINAFTATMMTVGAVIFIISPEAKLATVELFSLINQGDYGFASVMVIALTLITFMGNVLWARLLKNKGS